ncbi:hypothetical protein [Chryseobacterium sp. M5A1_1a]
MKKIYYFPGLISALLIPLLFWYYGNQKLEEVNIYVLDIWLPLKEKNDSKLFFINLEPYRNWNYKKIQIEPNTAKRNSKLYVSELNNLQKKHEKNTGIEFILNDKNTYGDFVSLLNDIEIANQPEYHFDLNKTGHIFVVHQYNNPLKNPDDFVNRCGTVNDYHPSEYYLKGFQKLQYQMQLLPQQSFYMIFGFLLFLNISMFSIKENLQIHKKRSA